MAPNPVIADMYIRDVSVAAHPIMMVFVRLKAKGLQTVQEWEKDAKGHEQTLKSFSRNAEPAPRVLLVDETDCLDGFASVIAVKYRGDSL